MNVIICIFAGIGMISTVVILLFGLTMVFESRERPGYPYGRIQRLRQEYRRCMDYGNHEDAKAILIRINQLEECAKNLESKA